MSELLPCSHCGAKARHFDRGDSPSYIAGIACTECGSNIEDDEREVCIAAWNRRAPLQIDDAVSDALITALDHLENCGAVRDNLSITRVKKALAVLSAPPVVSDGKGE